MNYGAQSGTAAMRRLLERGVPIDALFAANDQMAIGLMRAFNEKGRSIPADVSIVGFDDAPDSEFLGRRAVVSFPNFGHWQVRMQLLFAGHMPQTDILPYSWYDTPNIHHCTIKDFRQLCTAIGVKMEKAVALNAWGSPLRLNAPWWFWNLFGEQAVFLLSRKG